MKLFCERLGRTFVAEPIELGAFHDVRRYPDERTIGILIGHHILGEHGRAGRFQGSPCARVDSTGLRQPVCALQCRYGFSHVVAKHAVDLAGRKPGAIKKHLRAHDGGAARTAAERGRDRSILDRLGTERRAARCRYVLHRSGAQSERQRQRAERGGSTDKSCKHRGSHACPYGSSDRIQ